MEQQITQNIHERQKEPAQVWRSRPALWMLRCLLLLIVLPYGLIPLYGWVSPPSTLMLWQKLRGDRVVRTWVPVEHISPHLIRAVIASEDDGFCQHGGISWRAIQGAITRAQRTGKSVQGTSTITMQTAKNLFLWHGRSWTRKALEAPLSLWLHLALSKRRTLEIYLNSVEWGVGIFGAEQAALKHFGVSARALSPQQAAFLATSLPNPIKRQASRPSMRQRHLASLLLRRMNASDISCIRP